MMSATVQSINKGVERGELSALGISRAYYFSSSHAKVLRSPHRTLQNFEALFFFLILFFSHNFLTLLVKKNIHTLLYILCHIYYTC